MLLRALELIADVLVEFRQAHDTSTVARNLMSEMMGAFTSIISNDLEVAMKFLASATMILTVPVLIASVYRMKVLLPGAHSPLAFAVLLGVSLALSHDGSEGTPCLLGPARWYTRAREVRR